MASSSGCFDSASAEGTAAGRSLGGSGLWLLASDVVDRPKGMADFGAPGIELASGGEIGTCALVSSVSAGLDAGLKVEALAETSWPGSAGTGGTPFGVGRGAARREGRVMDLDGRTVFCGGGGTETRSTDARIRDGPGPRLCERACVRVDRDEVGAGCVGRDLGRSFGGGGGGRRSISPASSLDAVVYSSLSYSVPSVLSPSSSPSSSRSASATISPRLISVTIPSTSACVASSSSCLFAAFLANRFRTFVSCASFSL